MFNQSFAINDAAIEKVMTLYDQMICRDMFQEIERGSKEVAMLLLYWRREYC